LPVVISLSTILVYNNSHIIALGWWA